MLVRSPTFTKRLSSVIVNGSRPESRIASATSGTSRRRTSATASAIARMCSGVVPQQPPTRLRNPASPNSLQHGRGLVRLLVVLPERVGQAGVGVARHERVGDPAELGDVGPHLGRAQRAVEPDGERPCVSHRRPERLGDLAGQGAAGGVGDRARDDDRPAAAVLLEERLEGEDRRLGVEGVEDGLDHQQVGAALDQAVGGVEVGRHELVEGDVASAGVVDVGRDGRRARGRADRAGDVPRPVGRPRGDLVGDASGQPCGLAVELAGQVGHAVVGQRDRVGVEGVGLEDVGARPRGTPDGSPR